MHQRTKDRIEDAQFLREQGESWHAIATRLGVSISNLEIAYRRAGIYEPGLRKEQRNTYLGTCRCGATCSTREGRRCRNCYLEDRRTNHKPETSTR